MKTENSCMSLVIRNLKNLYDGKVIGISKVKGLLNEDKITIEEYNFILGKEERCSTQ